MSIAAALKFNQPGGGGAGPPATALLGAVGLPVTAENDNDLGVAEWTFEVIDVPVGSVVPIGVAQTGLLPTWTFTPDVTGCYLVKLTVDDGLGNTAVDFRVFGVVRASGRLIPAFNAKGFMLNFAGQTRGWAKYMEEWLIFLDGLSGGGGGGIALQDVGDANLDLTVPAFDAKTYMFAFHDIGASNRTVLLPTNTGGNTVAPGTTLVFMDADGTLGLPGGKTLTLNGGTRHIDGVDSPFVWTNLNVGPFGAVWLAYISDAIGWKII